MYALSNNVRMLRIRQ